MMTFYIVLICVLFAIVSVAISLEGQPKTKPKKKRG